MTDDQGEQEDHGQHQRGSNYIIKDLQALRQILQDMTDAQERERTRPCQKRAGRGNRGNPWKMNSKYFTEKETKARRVEQTSVRYSLKAITQNCREEIGMGRPKKEKKRKEIDSNARGLGFVVEILPTRRGDERTKAG